MLVAGADPEEAAWLSLGPFRQELISNHKFYVEQARKRLLSQFEDVSGEADKFAEEWLSKADQWFDPDRHDPDEFQEQAYDKSITFYGLLTDMHDQTRLSVIAGMYHEWDKQLRDWLSLECTFLQYVRNQQSAPL